MSQSTYFKFFLFAILLLAGTTTWAQISPLPSFSATRISIKKNQINWINPYRDCVQLSVQKSSDSLHGFHTIFSASDPASPINGYLDDDDAASKIFYRIFYVRADGTFTFTSSKKAIDLPSDSESHQPKIIRMPPPVKKAISLIKIFNKQKDSLLRSLDYRTYRQFQDSIVRNTKDTLQVIDSNTVCLLRFNPENVHHQSPYINLDKNGYINIKLPDFHRYHYVIVFYESNGKEIFRIHQIKNEKIILDKTVFVHAGWFKFEIYQDDILLEKNSFYLASDL